MQRRDRTRHLIELGGLVQKAGHPAPDHLLAHTAPLGWVHISLTGDYLWREPAAGADDFLALRLNERLSSLA